MTPVPMSLLSVPLVPLTPLVPLPAPIPVPAVPVAAPPFTPPLVFAALLPWSPVPKPLTLTPFASTAAVPTGGTLPREEPEKASPVDVPETDAPLVWPEVGLREAPVKASPLDVPACDTPLVCPLLPVVPVEEEVVAGGGFGPPAAPVAPELPVFPAAPGCVVVDVVAVEGAADPPVAPDAPGLATPERTCAMPAVERHSMRVATVKVARLSRFMVVSRVSP